MNLSEYSISVAEQFLQTAVFVDDKIYDTGRNLVNSNAVALKTRVPARKSAQSHVELVAPPESSRRLRCQDIVESFAKKRIVCSLYQLGKDSGAGPTSNLYKLVAAADILVVDWDIEGDRGFKAMQLVVSLVKSSLENEPEQLRSIIIYTAEPNLKASVADKLYEKLSGVTKGEFEIELKKEDEGLAFHTKNSRITIFGKPVEIGRSAEFKRHEVFESALAERAIAEFSKLASGLLQGAVLQGLALIRKNTRRIVTMFGADLDAPFLLHRALSLPKEEAVEHLIPLLVAEIESVLEDEVDTKIADSGVLEDWCEKHAKSGAFPKEKDPAAKHTKNAAKVLVREGAGLQKFLKSKNIPLKANLFKGSDEAGYVWDIKTGDQVDQIAAFLIADNGAKLAQAKLASLMSQRTYYSKRRVMSLGSVICDGKDYFLCIQPACDCVRLSGWSPFPFLKMEVSNSAFDIVLLEGKEIVSLKSDFKPSSLCLFYFGAGGASGIVEAKNVQDGFQFIGGSSVRGPKRNFRWVAQLKTEQSLRIIARISSQLGRVGLTESVWARTKAK